MARWSLRRRPYARQNPAAGSEILTLVAVAGVGYLFYRLRYALFPQWFSTEGVEGLGAAQLRPGFFGGGVEREPPVQSFWPLHGAG